MGTCWTSCLCWRSMVFWTAAESGALDSTTCLRPQHRRGHRSAEYFLDLKRAAGMEVGNRGFCEAGYYQVPHPSLMNARTGKLAHPTEMLARFSSRTRSAIVRACLRLTIRRPLSLAPSVNTRLQPSSLTAGSRPRATSQHRGGAPDEHAVCLMALRDAIGCV